ncbi:hypothetical protein BN1723_009333 [Verticillium longisporum]|uniref:Uncharacterized protein n=1 Tax=Verticillium longisporum TaxID=100787 RepID=A0A0G4KNE7_VERLO|nr:hypothetical protein BN1723_009333 [Verticillium longisporum]CRK14115.1 hypothetical protein BN1708_011062 [Verticillium longisporum]
MPDCQRQRQRNRILDTASHVADLTKPTPTSIRTACLPPPHLHSPVCPIKSRPALVGTDAASLAPKEASRRRALLEAQGEDRRSQVLDTERTSASKGQYISTTGRLPQHSAMSIGKGDEKLSLDNDVEARRKRLRVAVVVAFPYIPNRRADVELDRVATG